MKNHLLFLLLLCNVCYSQSIQITPVNSNQHLEQKLIADIKHQYDRDVDALSGSNKKYIASLYNERYQYILQKFTSKEIITDQKVNSYLSALVNEIVKANSQINASDLRILFSKAWWPNASCMGEGTILFNIGLFHRLKNESQAIFIICHELAHQLLQHSNNSINNYVNTVYSDAFQKQLKTIQKSDYKQNQQLEALARGITFKNRRHSREFEHAADSMAIELMKNTQYDLSEALSTLSLLDSVDKEKYSTALNLPDRFNFAAYPFKKSWLHSKTLMFAVNDEKSAETDSLKTHPDCSSRIDNLTEQVKKLNKTNSKKFIVSKQTFDELTNSFDFEILNYCFESKNISRCLYFALQMAAVFPDNSYLHTQIGKCLNLIYQYQKNHELSRIVDLPGSAHSEEYNLLLRMIQNLRLSEIAAVSYHYLLQFQPIFNTNAEFMKAFDQSKQNFNN